MLKAEELDSVQCNFREAWLPACPYPEGFWSRLRDAWAVLFNRKVCAVDFDYDRRLGSGLPEPMRFPKMPKVTPAKVTPSFGMLPPEPWPAPSEHICHLMGYDPMVDPECPGCEEIRDPSRRVPPPPPPYPKPRTVGTF